MITIKEGIKIINVNKIKKQRKDKTLKFIKNAIKDSGIGSMIIEVDDYNDDELICNISRSRTNDHVDLREQLEPVLNKKQINIFELWRFDYDAVYVQKKDRIIVYEKSKKDIDEFAEYCKEKKIDLDDLLYSILTL